MIDFTFLTQEQIEGYGKLDVLNKYGIKCAITDFAILSGGEASDGDYINEDHELKNRCAFMWFTKTPSGDGHAIVAAKTGNTSLKTSVHYRGCSFRPVFSYSSITPNKVTKNNGITEIEYGEYPQMIASNEVSNVLEREYLSGNLKETGKTYTTDTDMAEDPTRNFVARSHTEYEYNGKKYIRIIGEDFWGKPLTKYKWKISDGRELAPFETYWIEVEPIKWLVDEQSDIAISKKILFAGMQFDKHENYGGDFDRTDIKKFMDTYFSKEIKPLGKIQQLFNKDSKGVLETKNEERTSDEMEKAERKTRLQKINPDKTAPSQRRKMTDTEIIKSWIEAGQSVLLRGPSGIGKTERIRKLYPDLIYIKLTNNMFPEKVVGSVNLQTGQNIPPDFAKQAIMNCATEEERKLIKENIQNLYELADQIYERSKTSTDKVVIMLDELLNVRPAVQSLVYTLVLNKFVETGTGLKLPANTVIVATGNQKKYSSVAEDLAEPLEKRFDHILDMEPKVGEWIDEYAIPNKVHPSVIGYIILKYLQEGGSEDIKNMGYFYEEPEVGERHLDKNGCKGRTNDPRGWVSISNTLYAFETDLKAGKFIGMDVENLLQVSIGSKLRGEWAREFYDFYNIPTLSVEDVINNNYNQEDLPRTINERFAYITALLLADENQVGICRNFIRKYCDPEYLQLYDMCWIGNDERKMEKISELQELDMLNMSNPVSEGVGRRR